MNTLGKLMILLVFIMSIFFMTFAFMVFMTQASWMSKAKAETTKVNTLTSSNRQLETANKQLQLDLSAANAARTNAIAVLEGQLSQAQRDYAKASGELRVLKSEQQLQSNQVSGSIVTLQAERTKSDALQTALTTTQGDYDKVFAVNIDLRDQVIELEAALDRVKGSEAELLDQVAKQSAILQAYDLKENQNISGVAPKREGLVRKVGGPNNQSVVISLGEDDGLDRGNEVYVHRRDKYVGKVKITKVYPDRAVGRVIEGYQLEAIRSGDNVRTR